jgi:hypothetical protein
MRRLSGLSALAAIMVSASPLAAADPEPATLIAANMRPFAFADGTLSGPGAAFLEAATADSQFVLFGEDHYLHDTPIFAGALYRMLRDRHGFRHLVVEQDRVAMEDALAPANRGDARRLGALAARYPNLFEFSSDQDLELLALVGRLEAGPTAICGIEQALGPVRYFDEFAAAAPNAVVKAEIASLRAQALKRDPERVYAVNFLGDAGMPERLAKLRADFGARPGSRHDEMLLGLTRSSEIFRYYFRAEAGEPVGLFNNTVREAWFKRLFMDCYRRAATGKALPRALFKFGANHMYHGKNPTQAFPIGNFAHEFAIANGMEAYGLFVLPLMDKGYAEVPEWIRALLPATPPTQPVVIDLRSLRPVQRVLRAGLKDSDQTAFRELVNGFEALVVLPGERPATMALSGLKGLR